MPPTHLSAILPSPKRKRDQLAHIPLLNTTLRITSTPPSGSPEPSDGADSPRDAVADKLRSMSLASLQANPIPMAPLTPTDDAVRKKPKLEALREDSGASLEDFTESELRNWELEKVPDTSNGSESGPKEIPETPQSRTQSPSRATQPRMFTDLSAFAQPTMFVPSSIEAPMHHFNSSKSMSKSRNRGSTQPRQRKKSPSPPPSSLTWHDSEITGHLVDPSIDPEDDGTGLNGIGFKPTSAQAYARQQRRRQQLLDWKARETREARAKRSERRRRGVRTNAVLRDVTLEREVAVQEVDTALRRTVKFAI